MNVLRRFKDWWLLRVTFRGGIRGYAEREARRVGMGPRTAKRFGDILAEIGKPGYRRTTKAERTANLQAAATSLRAVAGEHGELVKQRRAKP